MIRRTIRWFVDWRNGAVIAASIAAAAVLFFVVDASDSRHDAIDALKATSAQAVDSREAASRRIDMLSQQVESLTGEVINLREMLLAAGVDPPPRPTTTAVRRRSTTSTTVRRAPSPMTTTQRPAPATTAPPASTTSQPPPTSTTSTTRPCAVSIPGVCL